MPDYAFYNAGSQGKGLGRVLVVCRRVLRRVLRPLFLRQVEIFEALDARVEDVARQQQTLVNQQERVQALLQAFQCEREAMARRLAVLEDHLEALLRGAEEPTTTLPFSTKIPA